MTVTSTMSFGKGILCHTLQHGDDRRRLLLQSAVMTAATFGGGSCWSILEDRADHDPATRPHLFIEVDDLQPGRLVGLAKDKEVDAVLRMLEECPFWKWSAYGGLVFVKGRFTLVCFVNSALLPRDPWGVGPKVMTLDMDQVVYYFTQALLEPGFVMGW